MTCTLISAFMYHLGVSTDSRKSTSVTYNMDPIMTLQNVRPLKGFLADTCSLSSPSLGGRCAPIKETKI